MEGMVTNLVPRAFPLQIHVCRVSTFNDLAFSVHYNYTKIGRFMPILSVRIVLSCFYPLVSHFENFST